MFEKLDIDQVTFLDTVIFGGQYDEAVGPAHRSQNPRTLHTGFLDLPFAVLSFAGYSA